MKSRIAQIIPYFGNWPDWIDLYFFSCGCNPMIDFIYYSDCPLPSKIYSNMFFHQCTFEEYKSMVSTRLGIDYRDVSPYKLTDLKPFLGIVHKEELKDYDFWGFGDIDLIYGDLSKWINEKTLSKYDVITTHAYRIAGHFCVVRNNEYYCNLCLQISGWREGLCEDQHHAYDELDWSELVNPWEHNISRLYRYIFCRFGINRDKFFGSLNGLLYRRIYNQELLTTPYPQPVTENECSNPRTWFYYLIDNKVMSSDGIELPYLHFMAFKKCQYVDTEDYWKGAFYRIESPIEQYKTIRFDYKGIYADK